MSSYGTTKSVFIFNFDLVDLAGGGTGCLTVSFSWVCLEGWSPLFFDFLLESARANLRIVKE